ncbi:MAG: saccharopine dehydrogenase [Candidatus Eisenbacteria bacterium]|nr:saccharopine dehydrogenase [Candidatus Eisenbacteria bacterium]
MRLLVLGGGLMGRAAASDMTRQPDVEKVLVADVDPACLEATEKLVDSEKLETIELNVGEVSDVAAVMEGVDAALGAVSYTYNVELANAAIDAGIHYCDLGGNNSVVDGELALDAKAKERGVTVIPDTGLAPGMVSLLAMHGVEAMDEAEDVHIRVGGLPVDPRPPLDYMIVFSVQGLINEYVEPCLAIRQGRTVGDLKPLTEVESISFPDPFKNLEAFHTSGGASTLPRTLLGTVRNLDYKTIRYPGHAAKMRAMYRLGLMSRDPVDVDGVTVQPRSVLERLLALNLPRSGRDVVLLRVTVTGTRDGRDMLATYEMVDYGEPDRGITAMMRDTAYPSAVICMMMARGETKPGASPQELAVDGARFIEELKRRGLPLDVRLETR